VELPREKADELATTGQQNRIIEGAGPISRWLQEATQFLRGFRSTGMAVSLVRVLKPTDRFRDLRSAQASSKAERAWHEKKRLV